MKKRLLSLLLCVLLCTQMLPMPTFADDIAPEYGDIDIGTPVALTTYSKVESLADIDESSSYILMAERDGDYYALVAVGGYDTMASLVTYSGGTVTVPLSPITDEEPIYMMSMSESVAFSDEIAYDVSADTLITFSFTNLSGNTADVLSNQSSYNWETEEMESCYLQVDWGVFLIPASEYEEYGQSAVLAQYEEGVGFCMSEDGNTWPIALMEGEMPDSGIFGVDDYEEADYPIAYLYKASGGSVTPAQPPEAPAGLSAEASGDLEIALRWESVSGASSYRLYRDGELLTTVSYASEYTDTGLTAGTAYVYTVTARNSGGESDPSDSVTATARLDVPSAPMALTAAPKEEGSLAFDLTWAAPEKPRQLTGYKVYRDGELLATVTELTYTDTLPAYDTLYTYTVTAVNATGESEPAKAEARAAATAPVTVTLALQNAEYAPTYLEANVVILLEGEERSYARAVTGEGEYTFPYVELGEYTLSLVVEGVEAVNGGKRTVTESGLDVSLGAGGLYRVYTALDDLLYAPAGSGWTLDKRYLADAKGDTAFWWPEGVTLYAQADSYIDEESYWELASEKTLAPDDFTGYTYTLDLGTPKSASYALTLDASGLGVKLEGLTVSVSVTDGAKAWYGTAALGSDNRVQVYFPAPSGSASVTLSVARCTVNGSSVTAWSGSFALTGSGQSITLPLSTVSQRTVTLDFSSTDLPTGCTLAGVRGIVISSKTWGRSYFTLDAEGKAAVTLTAAGDDSFILSVYEKWISDYCFVPIYNKTYDTAAIFDALALRTYEQKDYTLTLSNPYGESLDGLTVAFTDNLSHWTETLSDPDGDGVAEPLSLRGTNLSWRVDTQELDELRRASATIGAKLVAGANTGTVYVDRGVKIQLDSLPAGWTWLLNIYDESQGTDTPAYTRTADSAYTYWVSGNLGKTSWSDHRVTVTAVPICYGYQLANQALSAWESALPPDLVQSANVGETLSFAAPPFSSEAIPDGAAEVECWLLYYAGDTLLASTVYDKPTVLPELGGVTVTLRQRSYSLRLLDSDGKAVRGGATAIFDADSRVCLGTGSNRLGANDSELPTGGNYVLYAGYGDIDSIVKGMYDFWEEQEMAGNAVSLSLDGSAFYGTQTVTLPGPIYRLNRVSGQLQTYIKSVTDQGDGTLLVRFIQRGAGSYDSFIALPEGAEDVTLLESWDGDAVVSGGIQLVKDGGILRHCSVCFTIAKEALEADKLIRCYIITAEGKQLQFTAEIPDAAFSYSIQTTVSTEELIYAGADKYWDGPDIGAGYWSIDANYYADYADYKARHTSSNDGKWLHFETYADRFLLAAAIDGEPMSILEFVGNGNGGSVSIPGLKGAVRSSRTSSSRTTSGASHGVVLYAEPAIRVQQNRGTLLVDGNHYFTMDTLCYAGIYSDSFHEGYINVPVPDTPGEHTLELYFLPLDGEKTEAEWNALIQSGKVQSYTETITVVQDAPVLEKYQVEHLNGVSTVTLPVTYVNARSYADAAAYDRLLSQIRRGEINNQLGWNGTNVFSVWAKFDKPEGIARAYVIADVSSSCDNQAFELTYNESTGLFEGVGVLGDYLNPPDGFSIAYDLVAQEPYGDLPAMQLNELEYMLEQERQEAAEDEGLPEGWTVEEVAPENGWTLPETYRMLDKYLAAVSDGTLTDAEIRSFTDADGRLYLPGSAFYYEGAYQYTRYQFYNFGEALPLDNSYDLALLDGKDYLATFSFGMTADEEADEIIFVFDCTDARYLLPAPDEDGGVTLSVMGGSAPALSTLRAAAVPSQAELLRLIDTAVKGVQFADKVASAYSNGTGIPSAIGTAATDWPSWYGDLPGDAALAYEHFERNSMIADMLQTVAGLLPGSAIPLLGFGCWRDHMNGKIRDKYKRIAELQRQITWRNQFIELHRDELGEIPLVYHIDPSGYVFEGIDSQRVEGVTATVYQKVDKEWVAWNSEYYGEGPNPQLTNDKGEYGWDVLIGQWKVVFEKEGYYPAESEVLNVPPAHTDVNISLVAVAGASVESVSATTDYVELVFDKPVQVADVKAMLRLAVNGADAENISITAVDAAVTAKGSKQTSGDEELVVGVEAATAFRITADGLTEGAEVTLTAPQGIRSYNGVVVEAFAVSDTVKAATDPITAIEYTGPTDELQPGDKLNLKQYLEITGTEGSLEWRSLTAYGKVSGGVLTAKETDNGGYAIVEVKVSGSDVSAVIAIHVAAKAAEPDPDPDPTPTPSPSPSVDDEDEDVTPTAPVTPVTPVTPVQPVQIFDDVPPSRWSYEDVRFVYELGLMNGTGDGKFSPTAQMTRAMFVTVLYRLAGEPEVSASASFSDVAVGSWYEQAVAWAVANGITQGYGDGRFGTGDPVSREQMAVFLYRCAQALGLSTLTRGDLSAFPDGASVSDYAAEAMAWCVGEGILRGDDLGRLLPQGIGTREQVAAIFRRFIEGSVSGAGV